MGLGVVAFQELSKVPGEIERVSQERFRRPQGDSGVLQEVSREFPGAQRFPITHSGKK